MLSDRLSRNLASSHQAPSQGATRVRAALARVGRGASALALLTLWSFGCDSPESASPAPTSPQVRGRMLFESYCADCHGLGAQGDGVLANTLAPRPADLTQIRSRNGDMFIADAVAAYIDGRNIVEAHGPREMPVWGRKLDDRNEQMTQELRLTPELIDSIVQYLRTLQRNRPSGSD